MSKPQSPASTNYLYDTADFAEKHGLSLRPADVILCANGPSRGGLRCSRPCFAEAVAQRADRGTFRYDTEDQSVRLFSYGSGSSAAHEARFAITNTGSVTGIDGSKQLVDYSMTKGGIHAFTRALSGNLMSKGIRVNAVAPGPVWTPLNPSDMEADDVSKFGADTPMKRPAQTGGTRTRLCVPRLATVLELHLRRDLAGGRRLLTSGQPTRTYGEGSEKDGPSAFHNDSGICGLSHLEGR